MGVQPAALLQVADPEAGSFTEFVRVGLGNWAGFVSGWLYWYFWVVVVAIEAPLEFVAAVCALIAVQLLDSIE